MACRRSPWSLLLMAALLWAIPSASLANGWQWHSIPRPALIAGLESASPEVKAYAIRALGFRNDREVVPRLIEIVGSQDETSDVRGEGIRALAIIKDARAVGSLTDLLRSDPNPELRGGAAAALGQIGSAEALEAILRAYGRDGSLLARIEIIGALGQFPDPRAVAALAQELRQAESGNLRRRAAIALGQTGQAAAGPPLLEALVRPENEGFIGDIVDALGRSGAAAARQPLADLAQQAADIDLRVRATIALGSIDEGDVSMALIKLLRDPRPAIRYHAIRGLAQQGDLSARPALVDAYRAAAVNRNKSDEDVLLALTMRFEVVRALTDIDATGAGELLRDAAARLEYSRDSAMSLRLNEGAYELRRAAIRGLGYSDSDESARFLLETAVDDSDFRIRSVAVRSLGVLGRQAAIPALLERLQDEAPEVRWQTALVLGRFRDARAVGPLITALGDAHPEVRRQSAEALGYLGDDLADPALRARAEMDEDPRVRAAANQALDLLRR